MLERGYSRGVCYVLAVLAVGVVMILRVQLAWFLGDYARFLPFVLAVAFSAWCGGVGPGLLATALSAVAASAQVVTPAGHALSLAHARDAAMLGLFSAIGAMVSF